MLENSSLPKPTFNNTFPPWSHIPPMHTHYALMHFIKNQVLHSLFSFPFPPLVRGSLCLFQNTTVNFSFVSPISWYDFVSFSAFNKPRYCSFLLEPQQQYTSVCVFLVAFLSFVFCLFNFVHLCAKEKIGVMLLCRRVEDLKRNHGC